ncbi:MAG: [protein-PII] uridylyltransferase [Gallionellaceae bacterium]|jgi:[protein-PII] uridylyltransferase|nr:[protein-PII] uridylyltransferase [Gallionellaceae bacterium]
MTSAIPHLRESLRAARAALQADFSARPHPKRYLRAHAQQVDTHLRALWQAMPPTLALVAVGGYGRGELYPHSDIDLLILLPQQADDALRERLQTLVGAMWDIGLEVGHSVRTVVECLEESADITVQTNLLEARFLSGSRALFNDMREALAARMNRRDFYLAKASEQHNRHARYRDTDFNLEPNLKESPGGLRDLQTVLWISRASSLGANWNQLAKHDLLTQEEARAIARCETLLQTLRIHLHYVAGRREDRLLFDYQTAVAEHMRITASATLRASETMMRRYYRAKRAALTLSSILLQNLHARLFPEDTQMRPLNERFIARGNRLEAREDDLFARDPSAMLENFLLLEQHPDLTGLTTPTLRALWRELPRIDAAFRRDPRNRELFMRILRQPRGITHALRRMHYTGVLGRYIPAFGRITGQMQHDLFHVYTVDEHILMVVRNLRRFALDRHAREHPLCNRLMREFARPEALYLAGLFHDIAKGRGGDHSALGKIDAARFCQQHNLTREDRELVAWLVAQHLYFSRTAQTRDLTDPDVIAEFSANIPNERHLVALYLLTVADIQGTNPKIWNAWKSQLMESLFLAAQRYMAGDTHADSAAEIRAHVAEKIGADLAPEIREMFWAQLDTPYFLQHDADEIAWHTRLLASHLNASAPLVNARPAPGGEGLQVMVYCPDQPFLFARICTFFARLRYNIAEARIHVTHHGYALDSFLVLSAERMADDEAIHRIERELAQQIARAERLPAPPTGRADRQLRHFPITPEIHIEANGKNGYRLSLIAGDTPGLLARVARVLAQHRIDLFSARINTLGARAEDVLYIRGATLAQPEKVEALREELLRQMG